MEDKTKVSRLEKIAAAAAAAVIAAEYFLVYNNFDDFHMSASRIKDRLRWLPISESYFGDIPEIFAAILASGFVANKIEEYGERKGNKFVQSVGRHFPALTASLVGAYYTLGETILPQILPGTADVRDVPAVVIAAIASPFVANYVRKQWTCNWKNKLSNLLRETNNPKVRT